MSAGVVIQVVAVPVSSGRRRGDVRRVSCGVCWRAVQPSRIGALSVVLFQLPECDTKPEMVLDQLHPGLIGRGSTGLTGLA